MISSRRPRGRLVSKAAAAAPNGGEPNGPQQRHTLCTNGVLAEPLAERFERQDRVRLDTAIVQELRAQDVYQIVFLVDLLEDEVSTALGQQSARALDLSRRHNPADRPGGGLTQACNIRRRRDAL